MLVEITVDNKAKMEEFLDCVDSLEEVPRGQQWEDNPVISNHTFFHKRLPENVSARQTKKSKSHNFGGL